MITKEIVVGMLSILEGGMLQLREDTVVIEDEVELSRTYHRTTFEPGDDVEAQPQLVREVAALIWTPEVIIARKKFLEDQRAKIGTPILP